VHAQPGALWRKKALCSTWSRGWMWLPSLVCCSGIHQPWHLRHPQQENVPAFPLHAAAAPRARLLMLHTAMPTSRLAHPPMACFLQLPLQHQASQCSTLFSPIMGPLVACALPAAIPRPSHPNGRVLHHPAQL